MKALLLFAMLLPTTALAGASATGQTSAGVSITVTAELVDPPSLDPSTSGDDRDDKTLAWGSLDRTDRDPSWGSLDDTGPTTIFAAPGKGNVVVALEAWEDDRAVARR